jgi:hypothetical protein
VPFQISAPDSLNGVQRSEVRLIRFDGSPGALVTYGQGLSTIGVLERAHPADKATPSSTPNNTNHNGDGQTGLPAIQINGATGHELATALGTVINFQKGGVDYTLAGSVASNVAEADARTIAGQ